MLRPVVSMLASALVVLGAFVGWTSGDELATRVNETARDVGGQLGLTPAGPTSTEAGAGAAGPSGDASTGTGRATGPDGQPAPTAGAGGSTGTSKNGTSTSGGGTPGSASTTSRPSRLCRTPTPSSAADLNWIFRGLDKQPLLQGTDHGESVQLADGRRLFAFGDTVRDTTKAPSAWARNSVIVLDQGCIHPVIPANRGPVIPGRSSKVGYWPMSMRAVPTSTGTQVQMIATRVDLVTPSQAEAIGPTYVTLDVPSGGTPRVTRVTDLGPDRHDPTYPMWGAAMWESGGYVYLFGTSTNAQKSTLGWALHVARVRPGSIPDVSSWEYWDGSTWRRGTGREATSPGGTLVPADGGVSHVLSVFTRAGSWYAVSKEGDVWGDNLAVWKAPAPTGPWTRHIIGALPSDASLRRYSPQAHPDFPTASGRLLVSYSQSPRQARLYHSNPELYRPQFLEITLP